MKKIIVGIICLILLVVLGLSMTVVIVDNRTANIVIIAGQSNAEGTPLYKDTIQELGGDRYAQFLTGVDNVKYISRIYKDKFLNYKFGLNEYNQSFGLEVGIVDYWLNTRPTKNLYIVKSCVGGSGLKDYWLKDNNGFSGYTELCGVVDTAISQLKSQHRKINILGMCWLQGESDAGMLQEEDSKEYGKNIEILIDKLREKYGNFKFIDAEISHIEKAPYYTNVNLGKVEFAGKSSNNIFMPTFDLGLTFQDDMLHYDAVTQIKVGRRFGGYLFN